MKMSCMHSHICDQNWLTQNWLWLDPHWFTLNPSWVSFGWNIYLRPNYWDFLLLYSKPRLGNFIISSNLWLDKWTLSADFSKSVIHTPTCPLLLPVNHCVQQLISLVHASNCCPHTWANCNICKPISHFMQWPLGKSIGSCMYLSPKHLGCNAANLTL